MLIPIEWDILKQLKKMSFVKNAYIWLLFIPIVAKIFEKMMTVNEANIVILGHQILLSLSLPFSWVALYFSAVCFIFATVLFNLFCPIIIFENDSFSDFILRNEGYGRLKKYSDNLNQDIHKTIRLLGIEEKNLRDVNIISCQALFDNLYDIANKNAQNTRRFIFFLYSIGIALILTVLFQNFMYVIKYI
jgi:hypothetical protein